MHGGESGVESTPSTGEVVGDG
uniref:Uncharacterized protein n=1 Tax=Arundo donax TaxID=35708 RepID=A0A0A8ZIT7_ARUDO